MEHVKNLYKDSENLDVIVKGTVTGKYMNSQDEVLYQIETPCGECFEADRCCVYHDVTKPVVVKKFVADWYEKYKHDFEYSIWEFIRNWEDQPNNYFKDWMDYSTNKPIETLTFMHKFGYEVEKEKRYLVKMKDIEKGFNFLNFHEEEDRWIFSSKDETTAFHSYHTKKELEEAGFGEVFNSPLFEVEEVE